MLKRNKRLVAGAFGLSIVLLAAGVMFVRPASMEAHGMGGAGLDKADLRSIIKQAVAKANTTKSPIRSLVNIDRATKMQIVVVSRNGSQLAASSMGDAWEGAERIALEKARTAALFSSDENALTSRIIGILSQAHNPDGAGGAGPFWGIGNSHGIMTSPGGVAIYKDGKLVGGIGVSGDTVDLDEAVAFAGAAGFLPGIGVATLGY